MGQWNKTYNYIYIHIYKYIYSGLLSLKNKLYKMHGTYIKYIDFTLGGNLLTFTFTLFNWTYIVHSGSKQWLN